MATQAYDAWVNNGRPWRMAKPIAEIRAALISRYGDHVADSIGTIGNDAHLTASTPEDHCPFSFTGWPLPNPYPVVCALDYSGPDYLAVGRYWLAMARSGRAPWVKYINVDGEHYQFEGAERDWPSSDVGHVHLSIRTDWTERTTSGHQLLPGAAPPPPPPPPSHTPNWTEDVVNNLPTLAQGATGQAVRNLQGLLNAHGERLDTDGAFGPLTHAAVARFEVSHRVANSVRTDGTGDGIAGRQVWTALLVA